MSAPFDRVEQAPMLRLYGEHAPRVASLICARSSLLHRLVFAPRSALHSIAAFLYFSCHADQSDEHVAALIDDSDPRDLLRMAIPDAPPQLYRALDRAEDRAGDRSFYARLAALCQKPISAGLLKGDLTPQRFMWAEMLLTLDKATIAMHSALPECVSVVRAVDTLVSLLREHGTPIDEMPALPRGAKLGAVMRRIQVMLDELEAPCVPFVLPAPYKIISTVGELRQAGLQLKNCAGYASVHAADLWCGLVDGTRLFVTATDPSLLASFRRVGGNLFFMEQVAGPSNEDVGPAARGALLDAIRGSGMRLVSQMPSRALGVLAGRLGSDRLRDEDEFGEGLEAA